jgi:hypothetical protein
MIKKSTGLLVLLGVILGGSQISCDNAQQNKQAEEVHNPASQTIPDEAKDLIGRWDLTVDKEGAKAQIIGFQYTCGLLCWRQR